MQSSGASSKSASVQKESGVRPSKLSEQDPAGAFERRYQLVLWAVATLVILNQLIVQPALLRMATDAPLINTAGRQRMLSQRLVKGMLVWEHASNETERQERRHEVEQVLKRWTLAHESLRQADMRPVLAMPMSAVARREFDRLEPSFEALRDAATLFVQGQGPRQALMRTVLTQESQYLERMDDLVNLLETEARARVDRLRRTGWGVTALILAGLALTGQLSLRPAVRLIRRQILELNASQEILEEKVRARTEALGHESAERAKAEERHRALVEQFSLVARTSTLGEMATGLAHELNQPLGAIANYAEGCLVLTERMGPELTELREVLRKILATSLRAGQIVTRIRRFVTRHEPVREEVDANRLVAEVQDFFQGEAERQGMALVTDLAPDLPLVWGDPVQIQQVLVNLVRNAIESLSNSKTQNPKVLIQTAVGSQGSLEIRVRDNGEGIPPEQLTKVFDSFFSTRDEGMGMGLAISRTIAEAHQGQIEVESIPWVQTTFRLIIPADGGDDAGAGGLHR